MNSLPSTLEKLISQIPALQLLINLDWEYVTPEEALTMRGGKTASVFLDRVLEEQLRTLNRIEYRGQTELFTEANVATATRAVLSTIVGLLANARACLVDGDVL